MGSMCTRGPNRQEQTPAPPPQPRRRREHGHRSADGRSRAGLYAWALQRAGGPLAFAIVTGLVLLNASRFELWEHAWADNSRINKTSVQVVWNLTSLVIALTMSFSMEGFQVVRRLLHWPSFGQFLLTALLFTLASHLLIAAFRMGVSAILVATLGYMYLPIAAMLSVLAFPRQYGVLEWLSLAMITLATISFLLLRERNKWLSKGSGGGPAQVGTHVLSQREDENAGHHQGAEGYFDFIQAEGVGFVLVAVTISALGSILAERVYKGRPVCSSATEAMLDNFYINKVHIDLASLMFCLILWAAPLSLVNAVPLLEYNPDWFGPWTWHQVLMVFIAVVQSWLAGMVVKQYSTVCKSIAQTLSIFLAGVLCDPVQHRYDFGSRAAPTIALAVIVLLSAAIFQTGRIQRKFFDKRISDRDGFLLIDDPDEGRRLFAERWGVVLSPASISSGNGKRDAAAAPATPVSKQESAAPEHAGAAICKQHTQKVVARTLTLLYVFVFAVENLMKQFALSKTPIVMGTMNLMTFVLGACLASCMTLWHEGPELLRKAWHPWQIMKFLPCGILFAVSQAVVFMAYAMHTPASIVTVLGFVYTPISALGKRCVLGKVTMWLQWVALLITTMASMTFGFLQNVAPAHGAEPVGMPGLMCVIASATLAAFGSLFMERFLKDETDSFYVQKISLDLGSVLTSLALLPLSGLMSERPRDAFWRDRPLGECLDENCWGEVGSDQTCAAKACSCICGSGLFVAWDSYLVWLTLLIVIARGWFKGQVTKMTSTLEVAIAESFGPLLIYFVGEPVLFGKMLNDWALNSVVFIAPLSAVVFSVSEEQQKSVLQKLKSDVKRYGAGVDGLEEDEDQQRLCPLEDFLADLSSAAATHETSSDESAGEEQEFFASTDRSTTRSPAL